MSSAWRYVSSTPECGILNGKFGWASDFGVGAARLVSSHCAAFRGPRVPCHEEEQYTLLAWLEHWARQGEKRRSPGCGKQL